MVRRCQQLMYVFPVLRWLKVFSQTWEGDVTMVLPSSFMQLKKSITNPTNKDLLDACKQVLPPNTRTMMCNSHVQQMPHVSGATGDAP